MSRLTCGTSGCKKIAGHDYGICPECVGDLEDKLERQTAEHETLFIAHALTVTRKEKLMKDWLACQTEIGHLKNQLKRSS